jgi:hypothetical protein
MHELVSLAMLLCSEIKSKILTVYARIANFRAFATTRLKALGTKAHYQWRQVRTTLVRITKSFRARVQVIWRRSFSFQVKLPAMANEPEVILSLQRSFQEWSPSIRLPTLDRAKPLALRDANWQLLRHRTDASLSELLEFTVALEQIDWALDDCGARVGTREINVASVQEAMRRYGSLRSAPLPDCLDVCVSVRLHSVTIPEPAKDELVLDLITFSGADVDALLAFMATNRMIDPASVTEVKTRWLSTDLSIGSSLEEREFLESILRLDVNEDVDTRVRHIFYNIGIETHKFWRECSELITVRVPFDLSAYPFDRHLIPITITTCQLLDATQRVLSPDVDIRHSLYNILEAAPPRGFSIEWGSLELEPRVHLASADTSPHSLLRFAFVLRRQPTAFIWRTFLPSLVIVGLAITATGFAVFTRVHIESVMTQVIPSALIACVALQLSGSQLAPPHTGRTHLDYLFVAYYVCFFLSYLTLQFVPGIAAYYIMFACIMLLMLIVSGILWAAYRPITTEL